MRGIVPLSFNLTALYLKFSNMEAKMLVREKGLI